jgi:hypothetical protein
VSAKHRFLTALVIGIPVSFLVYGWNLMTLPPGTSYAIFMIAMWHAVSRARNCTRWTRRKK